MDRRFTGVKAAGFDLDQTLYPDLPEIREAVRGEFYKVIADSQGVPLEQAREMFEAAYAEDKVTHKVFSRYGLGIELVRDCLDRAQVPQLLKHDQRLVDMLNGLRKHYRLFLITDSRTMNAIDKMNALGIDHRVFDLRLMWDYFPLEPGKYKKDDGSAFRFAQRHLSVQPHELVYVGNSEHDDILPSAALGWKTIHVSPKPSPRATTGIPEIHSLEGLLL